LPEKPDAESREVSEGVVLDYDSESVLVGIDIDNASTKDASIYKSSSLTSKITYQPVSIIKRPFSKRTPPLLCATSIS
jgi:hypothetical protein